MSVRAYRVKKIELEETPTFNCWKSSDVISLAYNPDQYCDGGTLTFSKEQVEWGLTQDQYKKDKKALQAILKDMGDDDEVEYQCY